MGFFKFFFKKKLKPNVFFHIPKNGGSTLIGALIGGYKKNDKTPTHLIKEIENLQIFHVDFKEQERRFEGRELIKDISLYPKTKFFILFREPSKRLLSEFNFQYHILDGKNGNPSAAILKRLKSRPTTFNQYFNCTEVQNYQTKFLLGKPLASQEKVKEEDFLSLLAQLSKQNIFIGITEEYSDFVKIFEEQSSMLFPPKIMLRKKSPMALQKRILPDELELIKKTNNYDYRLYEFAKNKTKEYSLNLNSEFEFINPNKFVI